MDVLLDNITKKRQNFNMEAMENVNKQLVLNYSTNELKQVLDRWDGTGKGAVPLFKIKQILEQNVATIKKSTSKP